MAKRGVVSLAGEMLCVSGREERIEVVIVPHEGAPACETGSKAVVSVAGGEISGSAVVDASRWVVDESSFDLYNDAFAFWKRTHGGVVDH